MMANNEENDMKEFLQEYWKPIASAGLFLVSLIVSTVIIVKKSGGKVSVWDAIKSAILEKVPSLISIVEREGSGEEKKNAVLNMALREAHEVIGRQLTVEETELIVNLVSKQIELILATPQKKEAVKEVKVSPYRIQK